MGMSHTSKMNDKQQGNLQVGDPAKVAPMLSSREKEGGKGNK